MTDSILERDRVDLTNCDREPIHIPGAILPHGAMLVLECDTLRVLQAAGDTAGLLGRPLAELLDRSVDGLFSREQVNLLRALCNETDLAKPRHLLDPALRIVADQPLDASAHRVDNALVVEFEAAEMGNMFVADPLAAVQQMVEGFGSAASLYDLCQMATASVRRVAQYDRVMIYRFMADGSGWVIAESRIPELAPFLDLHYPAADIPQQARALYLKSWLRLITQVDYDPAPLMPTLNPRTGKPLDMSYAILRDVSPIHREYLRNMGIDASMSISIIVAGKLWGLIACHHNSPRLLPRHLRAVCELFGSMFSLQLEAREKSEQFEARLASRKILQELMLNLAGVEDYAYGLTQQTPNLLDFIHGGDIALDGSRGGGVAVRVEGEVTFLGTTPTRAEILALTEWLTSYMTETEGIFSTDRLSEIYAPAKAFTDVASGLLVIAVSRDPSDFILWSRPELVETALWAGDPAKPVTIGPNGSERISPRKSFEVWKHTVRNRALPWTPAETDSAFDLRVSLLQVVLRRIETAGRERAKAHERDKLLMAELDHRVKNTLANIQALVTQSSRSAESVTAFVEGLDKRIHSMAKAHSLLTQSRWEGVSVEGLLREELEAYGSASGVVALAGDDAVLTPKSALALSLALHELATNAAKYGAFSVATGHVAVKWHVRDDGGLGLSWTEAGGPLVVPPTRRGFGSSLIERALTLETGGRATIDYRPGGVVCDIVLPRASLVKLSVKPVAKPEPLKIEIAQDAMPAAPRLLVVEDSYLLILTLENMCEDLGWEIVGPASRLDEALEMARTETFDAALLDVNLDGEMSWGVADVLTARGIPFAFSTGYDQTDMLPKHLAGSLVVAKPYRLDDVEHRLRQMMTASAQLTA
ncbi:HWE histidine kinase domain-containing protein [Sphingomonas oligophenolica]|uniref:histidine kinase n=1 Tax=Sphingomonas oligophenolica TaxID=301154 RepID=A0A502BS90_9SPHN|nr:HWE histidine kinase domain-containing protein [Sphingomonas oligophenolica]TPG04085.1 GAF domain-containing protein [Sphingomonas oligophenolica]